MTTPEHLPDDFDVAIKAADDYADALDTLLGHDLPRPYKSWIQDRLRSANADPTILRDFARTVGGQP